MSYSNSSGGTLTLPSPTHAHHVDVGAAVVRSLRRSLSRSPSKFQLVRSSSQSSGSSANSAHSPSSRSPSQQPGAHVHPFSAPAKSAATILQQPTIATPFRPNIKLSVRSARPKAASAKPFTRTRTSPRSPLKRALSIASDSGNSVPSPVESEGLGQENTKVSSNSAAASNLATFLRTASPASRKTLERSSRHSLHLDFSGSSKSPSSRFLDVKTEPVITVSPLKRSEGNMSIDLSMGSPVAKRRSLHGSAGLGQDVNIFDQTPGPASQPRFDIHDESNQEYQLTSFTPFMLRDPLPSPTPHANMPRRTSSLRKSTLQQRYGDRTSFGRRSGEKHLAQFNEGPSSPHGRARLSLDHYVPPPSRDAPFPQSTLLNPSLHPMESASQRHPLSRSFTTSSSSSSIPDESPTHIPVQYIDRPRAQPMFARSLPVGALRPTAGPNEPLATPNYKHAKPFQAAFMSTGLVSKMNRNPEMEPPKRGGAKQAIMPDTPCKKQVYPSATYPPNSGSAKAKRCPTFGDPSTPFGSGALTSRSTFGNVDRVVPPFMPFRSSHTRKGSILSVDGDNADAHAADGDFPPTPTKGVLFKGFGNGATKSINSRETSSASFAFPLPISAVDFRVRRQSSELSSSPLDHFESTTPKTPRDGMMPPDASRLSISNAHEAQFPSSGHGKTLFPPATPTAVREAPLVMTDRRLSITPVNGQRPDELDDSLMARFDRAEPIGSGEFSQVFRVTKSNRFSSFSSSFFSTPSRRTPPTPSVEQVYAVKKIKMPFSGFNDRESKLREVEILRTFRECDHIVQMIDSWEENQHLYIQTEFCEEGSLDKFLENVGAKGRLDDFRIWKILQELCQGLRHIHDAGFVHLDLKPANIFVNYEGALKIGDFGMATSLPITRSIEAEGDREYIGPEILRGEYVKASDIFSLGLMVLEMACNVFLPENGPTWVALRENDMSVVPSLTWSDASTIVRDATGMPVDSESIVSPYDEAIAGLDVASTEGKQGFPFEFGNRSATYDAGNLFGSKRSEVPQPPIFMIDSTHQSSLDSIVRWMISRDPAGRPTVHQILETEAISWVAEHRHAGATVFEGNCGPEDPVMLDTEMTDV